MRIAFISTMEGIPWGGSEELWIQSALSLLRQGHSVAASAKWWPRIAPALDLFRRQGGELHTRGRPASLLRRIWRRIGGHDLRWLGRFQPDLVVFSMGCQYAPLDLLEWPARQGFRYAFVVQCGLDTLWPSDAEAERLADCYENAVVCYFVADANRELVERQLGVRLKNATLVANPFNVSYDSNPTWPADADCRLACVARLEVAAKGQDVLLEVLTADNWRSRNLCVSLFGTGPNEQALQKRVDQLGLSQVRFAGHVSDIAQIWTTHHALVLPSRVEGTPLALVEAMLCGRIGIVTAVGGNSALINDGETGFVAAAPVAELLDDALERAWSRRGEWQSMGQRAAMVVRKRIPPDPVRAFVDALCKLAR